MQMSKGIWTVQHHGLSFCFFFNEVPLCVLSVQLSHSVISDPLWPHGLHHARPPCPSPHPGVYSSSYPLSWWCHPTISSSVIPFSSHIQAFPASGSLPLSQFFTSGNQRIRASASASVLLMNIQDWFPLGLAALTFDIQNWNPKDGGRY